MNIDATPIGRLGHKVYQLAYRLRQPVAFGAYLAASFVAYALAYDVRFEFNWPETYTPLFWETLPVLLLIRLGCGVLLRLSTGRWRFIGTRDLFRLGAATLLGSLLFFVITWYGNYDVRVPRSILVFEGVLTVLIIGGGWVFYRTAYEVLRHLRAEAEHGAPARRVLLIGAGEAGNLLAREMRRGPTGYRPVGFVDDDPNKRGMVLNGLRVYGTVAELPQIVSESAPDEIIIALPAATPADLRRVVKACEQRMLPFKVLPGIREVLEGVVRLNQLRDVQIEDLLGREPIQLTLPELAAELAGRTVLITGAAIT